MTKILIVADDLTGALDSAVVFAERGLKTVVLRHGTDPTAVLGGAPAVIALATGTRELGEIDAVARLRAMVAPLAGWAELVFKKIDSRLKGHVAAETSALAEMSGRGRALIAPAIPDFGRMVQAGKLIGHGVAVPIDIRELLAGMTLSLDIPDVSRAEDLALAVTSTDPASTLLVGARGLAAALAASLPTAAPVADTDYSLPLLIAVGSRDPITLEQVAALHDPRIARVTARNGAFTEAFSSGSLMLAQMIAGEESCDSHLATVRFAEGLARLADQMQPRTILASGGETADSLLSQLGVGTLTVLGELLPGIPASCFTHAGRSIVLITKSGGFGQPDSLLRIVARLA